MELIAFEAEQHTAAVAFIESAERFTMAIWVPNSVNPEGAMRETGRITISRAAALRFLDLANADGAEPIVTPDRIDFTFETEDLAAPLPWWDGVVITRLP